MGWDGAGGYTRQRNFSADASAGIKILASAMDQEFNDFASAMTLALTRNGQNAPTTDLPMGGNKHINVGAAASTTNYLRAREFITQVPIYVKDDTAGTNLISASVDYFVTASAGGHPADGTKLIVRASVGKDASAIMILRTPFGTHSANIHAPGGMAIHANQIRAGVMHEFIFDSASACWQVVNPYRGVQSFFGLFKGKSGAGVVTGVAAASSTFYVNADGAVVTLGTGTETSVSVSASTAYFYLSVVPQVAVRAAGNTTPQIILQRGSAKANLNCVAFLDASGSVRYADANFGGGAAIFSANETFVIPGHTLVFITNS